MALDKQVHIYSVDTSSFYKRKEKKLHWKMNKLQLEKNELVKYINRARSDMAEFITDAKILDSVLRCKDINKAFKKYKLQYSEYEFTYLYSRFIQYHRYKQWKSYKTKLVKKYKQQLLSLLDKSVEYNSEVINDNNKRLRSLDNRAITDKNVISIFESTLTRTLGMKRDELSTDLFVIQVFYFDIIKDLILNGFMHNGEKYIFLTASAGQIRTKKTVFIKESLWIKYHKNLMCGLTLDSINNQGGVNVNKFMAYLALSNSATDVWEDFNIDKAIVIPDFETSVTGVVDFIDEETYEVTRKKMDINIEHTDGCGMILPSLSKENFMVRSPWIKGLLGVFDFRKFILSNNLPSTIKDIYGVEHDIIKEDIQVIFTKSMFKMHKYYASWDEYKKYYKQYNCQTGICNKEGKVIPNANINYQMLQSLTDITSKELHDIALPSIKRLENITLNIGNMLNVLGASTKKNVRSHFQEALLIYPELLEDNYCKNNIKTVQKSMVQKYKAGKLDVNGKYLFILPDLYAACEYWFAGVKKPKGLLDDKQVHCNVYKKKDKLACLRSPHLYREWAIRENICSDATLEWFTTSAVYTSSHDLISKLLQFDVDGDKSLVLCDEVLIRVAERNMRDIVPLYYNMKKAPSHHIDYSDMYDGMCAAWTGGNIGAISNDITKIWNTGFEISDDELLAIKLLCCENNFTIDYAKTLFKLQRPAEVDSFLKQYTRKKVPQFFRYAKDYSLDNVEPVNNSIVNNLAKYFKKKRLAYGKLPTFYYRKLMNNPEIQIDYSLINTFNELNKKYHYKINNSGKNNNLPYIISLFKNKMSEYEYSDIEITDMLIKYLYSEKNTDKKSALWFVYGGVIVDNLKRNIDPLSKVCPDCGARYHPTSPRQVFCYNCRSKKEDGVMKTTRYCVDCGKSFEVNSTNKRQSRCDDCNTNRSRLLANKRVQKHRKTH